MPSKRKVKKNDPGSIPDAFLNIVGHNMLQNELLLSLMREETGLNGKCFPTLESIRTFDSDEQKIPQLFILDCKNVDMKNFWASIREWNYSDGPPCLFVLCNAIADSVFEKKAMDSGVKGIFYNNDPLPLITKGICSVLRGDLWYSRKVLNKCLMGPKYLEQSSAHPALSRLTLREREILACIASGYSSKAISEEFSLSLHTVKTHIYNVYRKINVNNRLQASLWAANNL